MFSPDQYELLDFGGGRKLERFGEFLLDRPSAAAERSVRQSPGRWRSAHAKYRRTKGDSGIWQSDISLPDTWLVAHEPARLELRLTEFGQVGVFPEQAGNWDWIERIVRRASRELSILNLFAYTGGSTLAAAVAGARVVHIDAARSVVRWARRNADISGLAEAPVRWIAEDARKFVERELRRGKHYDGVILDPPSYGHGPQGEAWKLSEHLMPLLKLCGQLTRNHLELFLLTCHSPGFGPAELQASLADAVFGHCRAGVKAKPLRLTTTDGRHLPSGFFARWPP
jgi:23S rRNA (cytosine1962-C5)-methyltransferase